MGEIHYDADGHIQDNEWLDNLDKDEVVCFECQGRPGAYWVGSQTIFVCHKCAIDVVPKLIADAIASLYPRASFNADTIERAEPKILRSLWHGACSVLAARNRDLTVPRLVPPQPSLEKSNGKP